MARIFHERAHLRAFGEVRHHGDAGNVRQAEGVGGSLAFHQRRRRSDADLGEIDIEHGLEQVFVRDMDNRMRLERRADALLRPLDLERAGDDAAHGAHLAPLLGQRVVAPGRRHVGKQFEMHRLRVAP